MRGWLPEGVRRPLRRAARRAAGPALDAALARACRGVRRDPRECLVINGEPRSGTTWLAEAVRSAGCAVAWEPLHPREVPAARRAGFRFRHLCGEGGPGAPQRRHVEAALGGRLGSRWLCRLSPASAFAAEPYDRHPYAVKFVRASGMLRWLSTAVRRPVIHMVRHPLAIAASQTAEGSWTSGERVGRRWRERTFSGEPTGHESYLDSLRTFVERSVAVWCLSNAAVLRDPGGCRLVFYEDMLADPGAVLSGLLPGFGLTPPAGASWRTPSGVVSAASPLEGPESQLGKWRRSLTDEQVRAGLAVLSHFGVTAYCEELRPRLGGTP